MKKHLSKIVIIIILAIITLAVIFRKKPTNQTQIRQIAKDTAQVSIKTETIIKPTIQIETVLPKIRRSTKPTSTESLSQEKENTPTETKSTSPKDTLSIILSNNKPSVIDFGADWCQPCKMMKPIIAELQQEYENKANIIILNINTYQDLTNQYKIRLIPTQIFFDKEGKQYWRHEGFLAKEEIVKKLKELGVE